MPLSKPDLEKFKQADTQEKIFHQQVNSQFDRYEQQLRDLSTTPNINGAYLEGLTRETARNLYALRDSHKQTVYPKKSSWIKILGYFHC